MSWMTTNMVRVGVRAAAVLSLACAALLDSAVAQDAAPAERNRSLGLSLNTGLSWSDNIGRVPDAEDEGTLGQAGLLLNFAQRSSRIETDIEANAAYEHYFDDTFDNDVIGGLDGLLLIDFVPERLRWLLQENFGQITSDPFSADTPDNRENINYFTTGPDFTVRFGSALSLVLAGRYSNTAYEVSELDGERYTGSAALIRQLSGASSVSLNVSQEQIEFDDTLLNNEYDRSQAFARYALNGSRTGLSVDLGYTQIEDDGQTSDGLLARLSASRRVSASSTLSLSAGTQFSDAGDLFRDTQGRDGVRLDGESVLATADPFESRFAALGWDFSRNRTTLGLNVQYGEEDYENVASNDRTLTTWSAYFTRQLSRVAQLRWYGRFEDEQFDSVDFDDQELQLGAAFAWSIGRTLELRLQFDHYDRDSSAPATEYTENRASLFATWSPLGQR